MSGTSRDRPVAGLVVAAVIGGLVALPRSGEDLSVVQPQSKPIRTSVVSVDYAAPPESASALVNEASAAIVGEVRHLRFVDAPRGRGNTTGSDYVVNVTDVIKGTWDVYVGANIVIRREGGDIEGEREIVRVEEPGFKRFRMGGRYLLFLSKSAEGVFNVRYGPDGAYAVNEGKLQPLGRSSVARSLAERSAVDVVQQLRRE